MLGINFREHLNEFIGCKTLITIAQNFTHDAFINSDDFCEFLAFEIVFALVNHKLPADIVAEFF